MTDTSDAALITATRANLCDFFRHLAKSNHAGYFENERFIRWRTQIAHPGVTSNAMSASWAR
ncbi:MAG: hypothetical protein IPG44_16000 [Anaerolineales bacterium]|nr:hypothetical protein [Anaerolineales bacterium]